MVEYLTEVLRLFISNPFGYVHAALVLMIFAAVGYTLLRFFGVLMGFEHQGLVVKTEWELEGRGVVSFDRESPDYCTPDRVRYKGQTVYQRFSPGAHEEYVKAREHWQKLHGTFDDMTESDFNEMWNANPAGGNPVFKRR